MALTHLDLDVLLRPMNKASLESFDDLFDQYLEPDLFDSSSSRLIYDCTSPLATSSDPFHEAGKNDLSDVASRMSLEEEEGVTLPNLSKHPWQEQTIYQEKASALSSTSEKSICPLSLTGRSISKSDSELFNQRPLSITKVKSSYSRSSTPLPSAHRRQPSSTKLADRYNPLSRHAARKPSRVMRMTKSLPEELWSRHMMDDTAVADWDHRSHMANIPSSRQVPYPQHHACHSHLGRDHIDRAHHDLMVVTSASPSPSFRQRAKRVAPTPVASSSLPRHDHNQDSFGYDNPSTLSPSSKTYIGSDPVSIYDDLPQTPDFQSSTWNEGVEQLQSPYILSSSSHQTSPNTLPLWASPTELRQPYTPTPHQQWGWYGTSLEDIDAYAHGSLNSKDLLGLGVSGLQTTTTEAKPASDFRLDASSLPPSRTLRHKRAFTHHHGQSNKLADNAIIDDSLPALAKSRSPSPTHGSFSLGIPKVRKPTLNKTHRGNAGKAKPSPTTTSPHTPIGFVNFTPDDSHKILSGVAPSGSSKTKARREKEAADRRRRLSLAAARAVMEAGGDLGALEREGLLV